jgi:hypothetical protein
MIAWMGEVPAFNGSVGITLSAPFNGFIRYPDTLLLVKLGT